MLKILCLEESSTQASDKDRVRILRTQSALKLGNQVLPEDCVQTDRVLSGHQAVYNLQH